MSSVDLDLILDRVLVACQTDATLRTAVKSLAERATRAIACVERTAAASDREPPTAGGDEAPRASLSNARGRRRPPDAAGRSIDLELVERRLRLKANGARWAAERRRRLQDPRVDFERDVEPEDREVIRRAKEIPSCFLWTNAPDGPEPSDLASFETLAECYENAAAAVSLVQELERANPPASWMPAAFKLLAEAQAALRVAVAEFGRPEDVDQFLVFSWLKANTRARAIYVARHMRREDPADPRNSADLATRIASVARSSAIVEPPPSRAAATAGRIGGELD